MMYAFTDGACRVSNPGTCSCAFAIFDGEQLVVAASRYLGDEHTNNFAEYSGMIDCLEYANEKGLDHLRIYCDSQLVVKQLLGEWKVKHADVKPLYNLAYALLQRGQHELVWIRGHEQAGTEEQRRGNTLVDKMCNDALDKEKY